GKFTLKNDSRIISACTLEYTLLSFKIDKFTVGAKYLEIPLALPCLNCPDISPIKSFAIDPEIQKNAKNIDRINLFIIPITIFIIPITILIINNHSYAKRMPRNQI